MVNLKTVNLKALQSYKQKLKELKTWAQVKSPKSLQPALNYTLGWLAPELLGTGFRMVEISDFTLKGIIPANTMNKDANDEIHQGLVLNGCIELAKTFINRHLPENFYRVVQSDIKISKHQKWTNDVQLVLSGSESILDEFFSRLQGNNKSEIQFHIHIESKGIKKNDSVLLKFVCEATNLLT